MAIAFAPVARSDHDIVKNVLGIPFRIQYDGDRATAFDTNAVVPAPEQAAWRYVSLAGMVGRSGWCSEWWGQNEPNGCCNKRLFIGDRLGFVQVVHTDRTQETVELIFGLNVWNYDLFIGPKPYETWINAFEAPYDEPFRSDPAARALLDDALVLHETDGDKGTHYVLCVRLNGKPVDKLLLQPAEAKADDVFVSAITFSDGLPATTAPRGADGLPATTAPEGADGLPATTALQGADGLPEGLAALDPKVFLNRSYQDKLNRLAHRLYQFRADVPDTIEPLALPDSPCPQVRFYGGQAAQVYTNVYNVNMRDMALEKVDADGRSHTSSRDTYNFGGYIGLGTFNQSASYYDHMWTRDVGRVLLELAHAGVSDRLEAAADCLHRYLDASSERFPIPNWKRMANVADLPKDQQAFASGKENDGHASTMLFIYQLYRTGVVDGAWVRRNEGKIFDAANFFFWQMDHPAESNFDRVLYSESEASTQVYGGYDLFSNAISYYALLAYQRLCAGAGLDELAGRCGAYAERLLQGVLACFVFDSERYGPIFVDNNYDCWTYEYKRFAPLFLRSDFDTYDPDFSGDRLYQIARNTLAAQADGYLRPEAGRQMGYGQGYLCHTAAMLDDFALFTDAVEAGALFCYHHTDHSYIVPEGVILHPNGQCWYRNCDQGNAVQQAEMVKVGRLMLGLDDLEPDRGLAFVPRLPDNFSGFSAEDYPVCDRNAAGRVEKVPAQVVYSRTGDGYRLQFAAARPVLLDRLRIGPFPAGSATLAARESETALPVRVRRIAGRMYADICLQKRADTLDITVSALSAVK